MKKPLVLIGAACLLGGCCSPGGNRGSNYSSYHFESDCSGDLCGFTVAQGTASRFVAFPPGEHALQLSPGAEIQHTLSSTPTSGGAFTSNQPSIAMLARCDPGTRIRVEVVVSAQGTADGGSSTLTVSGELSVTSNWSSVTSSLGNSSLPTAASYSSQQLTIQLIGPGSCAIDDVVYSDYTYGAYCG